MSQLSLKTIKLGDSADTSKNFLISVPATPDGSLTIERENGTDVLTVDANGVITANCGIGANQSYQDVTASRAVGVTYINNTGRTIFVYFTGTNTTANTIAHIYVNGALIGFTSVCPAAYGVLTAPFIVPPGASYSIAQGSGVTTNYRWWELK